MLTITPWDQCLTGYNCKGLHKGVDSILPPVEFTAFFAAISIPPPLCRPEKMLHVEAAVVAALVADALARINIYYLCS